MRATGREWLLTIERAARTRNGLGEIVETWAALAQAWADRRDVSDSERVAAAEVSATITTRFVLLWSPAYADLNPKDRLICDGRTYDIWGVKYLGRNDGLEVTAAARAD